MSRSSKPIFLVCVSPKDHAKNAAYFACLKAKQSGGIVRMLYIIEPMEHHTMFSVADIMLEERREEANVFTIELAEELNKKTGISPEIAIAENMLEDAVIETINNDENITMLIMGVADDGSSSRSGLTTSLTEDMGKRFHIPMLLVPGDLTHEQMDMLV